MMQAGQFNESLAVLQLEKAGDTYAWQQTAALWGKAERQEKTNLFSKVGLGAKSVRFTIRSRPLTLHNAIRWQGKHCFLTDIREVDRMYLEVTAALIEPVICTVECQGDPTMDEFNRPVLPEPEILSFPGCLTEKYMGFTQQMPQSTVETTFVLVTPKEIGLHSGQLVTVDGNHYNVQLCHTLDEFKNEYEINREEEPQCKTSG